MKRLVSITLIVFALALLVSCHKEKKGLTVVDYGEVSYVLYEDGTPLSFEYLDCFKKTEMEELDDFITYTDDRLGVLTYKVYDPTAEDHDNSSQYDAPSKNYAEISAFTDEEAENYLRIALGMISSQGAEYTVEAFTFEKLADGSIRLYMDAKAVYERTGEIQKLWMLRIITPDDRVYTLQAFAPASVEDKYGPAFRNARFSE